MAEEKKHALLSPSKAVRWINCPGSVAFESTLPKRPSSSAADEGTAAHELAEICLTTRDATPEGYLGMRMSNGVAVDSEMVTEVGRYVAFVRGLACSKGDVIMVEQELPLEELTGEEGAIGTADAVIMVPDELIVVDLKYGKGHMVEAEDNYQLVMYALAARSVYKYLHDFSTVRTIIYQPRREHIAEAVYTLEDLDAHEAYIAETSSSVWAEMARLAEGVPVEELNLIPSEEACMWCAAKSKCPKLEKLVSDTTDVVFEPIADDNAPATLGDRYKSVPLIRQWCDAVEADVERELKSGKPVPGFKLVIGRKGNRAWQDETEAEKLLKSAKLKHGEMYTEKLISPSKADDLNKAGRFSERMWKKISENITSPSGKPTVVPESDKRPTVVVDEVEFEPLQ